MKSHLSLSIGDIILSVNCEPGNFFSILEKRYQYFLTNRSSEYNIEIDLKRTEYFGDIHVQSPDRPSVSISKEGALYTMTREDNPFIALYNEDSGEIQVSLRESPYCFDSFLRILLMLILAGKGGLLLHSCSIDDNGKGRVFFGPSESGKTTIARLANERLVLSDEISIIRPRNGTYFVHGTPFWGEFQAGKNNHSAELTAMYAIEKSTSNKLFPIKGITAISKLYRCVFYFGNVPDISSQILETCINLSNDMPIFHLDFTKDPSFWNTIRREETRDK